MLNEKWSVELTERPVGSLLAVESQLVIATESSRYQTSRAKLHGYDLTDGFLNWSKSFERRRVSGLVSNASSDAKLLIALDSLDWAHDQGVLLALDSRGEERWRCSGNAQRISAPAVEGSVACVTAGTNTLSIIDVESGRLQNTFALDFNASFSAPALSNGIVYIPCRGPHLWAVGLNGHVHWQFNAKDVSDATWLHMTPTLIGDRILVVTSTGSVLALATQDGYPIWQVTVGPEGKRLGPPTTDGERLYVGASDGLYAFNPEDGHQLWAFATTRRIRAASTVVGGVVYAACHDHHLYALDALSGKLLWRYEVGERRIELSPVVTELNDSDHDALVMAANRGGFLVSIVRPLSAKEHDVAGDWRAAVSAYDDLGQISQAAQILESHDESLEAAKRWESIGETERAAQQYEVAEAWQRAAQLWKSLDQFRRRARCLKQYAMSLSRDEVIDISEKVEAWQLAADAFREASQIGEVATCQQEIARLLRQPVISIDVVQEGLVLNRWTHIKFVVRNEGYGTAHQLVIRAKGSQFEGEIATTQEIMSLRVGGERSESLNVCPREYGDSVPLRLSIQYRDDADHVQACGQTVYLNVAQVESKRNEPQSWHIHTGGGTVVFDGVNVSGGDFIGRDQKYDSSRQCHTMEDRIKILLLTANPMNTQELRLDEEARAIDKALNQAKYRDRFDVRSHWAVQVSDIQEILLRHQPDIVHFCGHGSQYGEIMLEDEVGNSHPVSPTALSELFSILKGNIRCVVLNACFSEQQAHAIAEHIDCVIGMSQTIGDKSAISFATAFYRALGYGRDVWSAFELGRSQINLENLGEQDVPQLITTGSDPKQVLFVREE